MNITKCVECGCTKDAEDRVGFLEAENARLQSLLERAVQGLAQYTEKAYRTWIVETERDGLQARVEEMLAKKCCHETVSQVVLSQAGLAGADLAKTLEGLAHERDDYKAQAERRGRAGVFLRWYIGQFMNDVDPGDTVRSYGVAAYAALTTPEIKNT